ncbi:MAG: hypothetical protein IAF38_13025 [Bacteroidia bacterium]|nr:hypothetical protein [Bacteroidia bacterium]
MKKSIVAIIAILVCSSVFAQEPDSSIIVGGLNVDFGVYATESYDKTLHTTDDDGAASRITSIWGEYIIKRRLGVGLKLAGANYVTTRDSFSNTIPTAKSFDIGLTVNYYLVSRKKFSLPIGITFGTSSFTYSNNWTDHGTAKDRGTFLNIGIYPRIYFGKKKKFGMNFKLAFASYAYNSMDFKSDFFTLNDAQTLKGKGVNIGFGLQYRIK